MQETEDEQVPDVIGPLRLCTPSRDPNYARRVDSYKSKVAVVRKKMEENPLMYDRCSSDERFWNFFHQDYYETVLLPRSSL